MTDVVKYFGYGANASAEMMEAIIGRKPIGISATLEGHQLHIQTWDEIPENVMKILSNFWTPDFVSYTIASGSGKVNGVIWSITQQERELVNNWELVGLWYQHSKTKAIAQDGKTIEVDTEKLMEGHVAKRIVDGEHYQHFLNNKERMLEVAGLVRKDYLASHSKKPVKV